MKKKPESLAYHMVRTWHIRKRDTSKHLKELMKKKKRRKNAGKEKTRSYTAISLAHKHAAASAKEKQPEKEHRSDIPDEKLKTEKQEEREHFVFRRLIPGYSYGTLYGCHAKGSNIVAYCHYHRRYITVRQLHEKRCIAKLCPRLSRRYTHTYWIDRKRRRAARKKKGGS